MAATATDVKDRLRSDGQGERTRRAARRKARAEPHAPFSIRGRLGVLAFNARAMLAAAAVLAIDFGVSAVSTASGDPNATSFSMLWVLLSAPLFAYLIFIQIRRLHDLDRSGWFLLLVAVPVLGLVWMAYYSFMPGSTGDNRFGERRETSARELTAGMIGATLFVLSVAWTVFAPPVAG